MDIKEERKDIKDTKEGRKEGRISSTPRRKGVSWKDQRQEGYQGRNEGTIRKGGEKERKLYITNLAVRQ